MSTTSTIVTLDYIIGQARKRAKYERSNFVVSQELYEFARGSIRELYDLLVDSFEDYRLASIFEDVAVLDATDSQFILPKDFYKLRGVDYGLGGNQWVTLQSVPWNERNRTWSTVSYGPVGYMLLGEQIFDDQVSYLQFIPRGNVPASPYRIYYTPKPLIPVVGTDKVDGIQGWEEYVIWDTTAHILTMASRDPSVELSRKAAQEARIREMSKKRDAGMAKQSALTQRQGGYPYLGWR